MSDTHATAHENSVPTAGGTFDLIKQGARSGAVDARAAAERAWSSSGVFVRRFVYTAGYTVSYGVVFSAALLARSIPRENAAVRGLVDGAKAAQRKVDATIGDSHAEPAPSLATV
ncbi:MAG TPA: hypothetical protein VGH33_26955 [Isosphaeraceae bacterium]